MIQEVYNEFDKLNLKEKKSLLAFSGGGDSVFLLFLLANYFKDKLKDHISLCYINYHDSPYVNKEEEIVYHYVNKYSLKIYKNDVHYIKEIDHNFEEWARKYRYSLFIDIIKKNNLDGLLVAHQKTDLVETYLLQKSRKNLPQYYGLKTVSMLDKVYIYRPMLSISKDKLTSFLDEKKIPYYDDITNKDRKKARTLVREKLHDEKLLDEYIDEIQKENNRLASIYDKFNKYREFMPFSIYNSFTDDEKRRFCFYLIDDKKISASREGIGKNIYFFLKKETASIMKLDDVNNLYRTNRGFFISSDLSQYEYEVVIDKEEIYENDFIKIDFKESIFHLSLPITIRNYHVNDHIETLIDKDVKTFLKKQGVPEFLFPIYPVILKGNKIKYVPFYKDVIEKRIPISIKYISI